MTPTHASDLATQEVPSEEKRRRFDLYYRGWSDCFEGHPCEPPPFWTQGERDWYVSGWVECSRPGGVAIQAATGSPATSNQGEQNA